MYISIAGDSISTFEDCNPPGYEVFYDAETCAEHGLRSVTDTWWAKVIRAVNGELCVNASYSGSMVSGRAFPSACSAERIAALHTQQCTPELILCYIGFNDFGYGVPVKRPMFSRQDKRDFFADAYRLMVRGIKKAYPPAGVVCATLLRTSLSQQAQWRFPERFVDVPFDDYNDAIRDVCAKERVLLADLAATDLRYETLDGSHPTAKGHDTLALAWIQALRGNDLVPEDYKPETYQMDTCHIFDLYDADHTIGDFHFDLVEDYGDRCNGHALHIWDDGGRKLVRCRDCGALVLIQKSELHSFTDGPDAYYIDYFAVSSAEEARGLNQKYSGFDLEKNPPGRHIYINR